MRRKTLSLISDFNIEPLSRILSANYEDSIKCGKVLFGQVYQSLFATSDADIGVIWTQPQNTISEFNSALNSEVFDINECLAEVEKFSAAILNYSRHVEYVLVASWTRNYTERGYGLLDWKEDFGISNILARMNLKLAECLSSSNKCYILDSQKWLFGIENAHSPKMGYAAKVPFTAKVFQMAATDIFSAINTIAGATKKLIVVDLDNTLWGGVVGEYGWEGITLGGHDFKGEAFVDFQKALKSLERRGILLAIVSKNDESVALEAINNHPNMVLKETDFCGWRINWGDKAENIRSLIDDLNIGMDSVVFIDDNPAERQRVLTAYPEIMVPDWPLDVSLYAGSLKQLNCFDSAVFSEEDRLRTQMYRSQELRVKSSSAQSSKEEWLESLNTVLVVSYLDKVNIKRVTQLFNKTNQLNLATRRLSESELEGWAEIKTNHILTVSVSDSFGNLGLVGVVGMNLVDNVGVITDFILSCRAMGREVEKSMLYCAIVELIKLGAEEITATYIPTDRNRPTLDVFGDLKLFHDGSYQFKIPRDAASFKPSYTKIVYER
ncbi:HAD-IIIC family phosphatase [Pseudomonadales bacterium]|nr:HAD-IIIC family phosphatase [Pseudomonadales bacterium]